MFLIIGMGLFGGLALALWFNSQMGKDTFEKRKAGFAEGRIKKDPMTEPMGPHHSFGRNFVVGMAIFAFLGLIFTFSFGLGEGFGHALFGG